MHPLLKVILSAVVCAISTYLVLTGALITDNSEVVSVNFWNLVRITLGMGFLLGSFFMFLFSLSSLDQWVWYEYENAESENAKVFWITLRLVTYILRIIAALITLGFAYQGAKYMAHKARHFGK